MVKKNKASLNQKNLLKEVSGAVKRNQEQRKNSKTELLGEKNNEDIMHIVSEEKKEQEENILNNKNNTIIKDDNLDELLKNNISKRENFEKKGEIKKENRSYMLLPSTYKKIDYISFVTDMDKSKIVEEAIKFYYKVNFSQ